MARTRPHQYGALDKYSIGSLSIGAQQATVDGINQYAAAKGQNPNFNGFLDAYLGSVGLGQKPSGQAWGSTGDVGRTPELPLREKMQAAMGFVDTQALGLNKQEIRDIGKIQGLEGLSGAELKQALAAARVRPEVIKNIMEQKDPAGTVGKIHNKEIIDGKVGPVTRAAWAKFMGEGGPGQKFAANPDAPTPGASPQAQSPAYSQGQLGNKPQVTSDMLGNGTSALTPPKMEGPVKTVKTERIVGTPQGMKAEQAGAPVNPPTEQQLQKPVAAANVLDPNAGKGGGTMVAPKPEVGGAPNPVKTVRISAPTPH